MWKRITAIVLCISMLFVITACGNQSNSSDSKDTKSGNQTEEKVSTGTSEQKEQSENNSDKTDNEQKDKEQEAANDESQADNGTGDASQNIEAGNQKQDNQAQETANIDKKEQEAQGEARKNNDTNILVVYFSRTGEQYNVGVIDKGNTAIIADMIAEKTGADTFEILPAEDYYPTTYKELTEVAQKELRDNARPAIKDTIQNFSDYDTVFIGYPIWWGDVPMIVYTFLESYDFSGKKVIPFCTHAGSGLSSTVNSIKSKVSASSVEKGLAVEGTTAQNNRDKAESAVNDWLSGLGY